MMCLCIFEIKVTMTFVGFMSALIWLAPPKNCMDEMKTTHHCVHGMYVKSLIQMITIDLSNVVIKRVVVIVVMKTIQKVLWPTFKILAYPKKKRTMRFLYVGIGVFCVKRMNSTRLQVFLNTKLLRRLWFVFKHILWVRHYQGLRVGMEITFIVGRVEKDYRRKICLVISIILLTKKTHHFHRVDII